MIIILVLIASFWCLKKWHIEFYVEDSLVELKDYNERSIFKKPLKKIFRAQKHSKDNWDIYYLSKTSRLFKIIKYKLTEPSQDDRSIIREHQEKQDAVN